jgi:hypothetical protein
MKEKDHILHLIAKKLAGEASAHELGELEQQLKICPVTSYRLELLTRLWRQHQRVDIAEIDKAFARHLRRMAEKEDGQEAT